MVQFETQRGKIKLLGEIKSFSRKLQINAVAIDMSVRLRTILSLISNSCC